MMRRTKTPSQLTPGDLRAGSVLGTYELLEPIAEGGTAIVWAARLIGPRRFQQLVAVKTIRRAYTGDPRFERMLRAEGAIASRAQHPNIAQIREFGETDSTLFLAMEWVHGEPLTTVEAQCPYGLPVVLAARIVADAALGLHAVHSIETRSGERMGLVHCDISPHNLLLTTTGQVKVVDFGVARASHPAAISACPDGFVGGKPSFMAPEQADGAEIDHRVDVFALGIVLYRLITGSHPFPGGTALERLRSMQKRSRLTVPPVSLRAQCTDALSVVVLRALEKDPAQRFQSMSAFADALADAVPAIEDVTCREELADFARAAVGEAVAERAKAIAKAIRGLDTHPIILLDDVLTELDNISYPDGVPAELERISVPFLLERERPVSLPDDAFLELDGEDETFAEEEAATLRRSTYRPVILSEPPPAPAFFRRGQRSWLLPAALLATVLIGLGVFLQKPAPADPGAQRSRDVGASSRQPAVEHSVEPADSVQPAEAPSAVPSPAAVEHRRARVPSVSWKAKRAPWPRAAHKSSGAKPVPEPGTARGSARRTPEPGDGRKNASGASKPGAADDSARHASKPAAAHDSTGLAQEPRAAPDGSGAKPAPEHGAAHDGARARPASKPAATDDWRLDPGF